MSDTPTPGKTLLLAPYLMAILIREGSDIPTDEWYAKAEALRQKKTGQLITEEKRVTRIWHAN